MSTIDQKFLTDICSDERILTKNNPCVKENLFLEHVCSAESNVNKNELLTEGLNSLEDIRSAKSILNKGESYAEILSSLDKKYKSLIDSWISEQEDLKKKLKLTESKNFLSNLKYVAGVDLSFPSDKNDLIHASASIVVLSYPDLKTVYKKTEIVHLTSIYIPQFLAFREFDSVKKLFSELNNTHPQYFPDLVLVDGNGLLHPRKFGFACHLGVSMNIPSIGVAKKLFHVDDIKNIDEFKNKKKLLKKKGELFELVGKDDFVYGCVLRSTSNSPNPIILSVGHNILLTTAIEIVNHCCKFRIPEPVRLADQFSREYLRLHYAKHIENCNNYDELNKYFNEISLKVNEHC
ncbi:endonuclease V [Hydra vulgaris]|uniref:endonuclease V n=1 Tax=Hydra vulgaris TaxID=6087 RepID=UPI001F5E9A6D|nr:endonuclease V [Hydra vulgaris]